MPRKVIFIAGSIGPLKRVAVDIIEKYRAQGISAINFPFGQSQDLDNYESYTLEQCLAEANEIISNASTDVVILHGWKTSKFVVELKENFSDSTRIYIKVFRTGDSDVPKNYLTHSSRERLLTVMSLMDQTAENFYSANNLNYNWKPRSQDNAFNDDWTVNEERPTGKKFILVEGSFTL